ncbi:MAG: LptF/LptG family permease [Proteobacteria bacterium]|nr:LptF/LptG family permease [Pseudomonadota bacterium]
MTPRRFTVTRIDRYLLWRMAPRMAVALLVTLLALMLERVLRLIDLVATQGASLDLVVGMALNLVPHYLGLALPATFCIAVLTALAALSSENEIDMLENAGWSLRRIGAPFIAAAVVLALISLPLFGVLQPYSRYAYRAIKHAAQNAGWTGRLEEGVFVDAGNGLLISAGEIDPTGRVLSRVFVIQRDEDTESVYTAKRGLILPDPEARVVRLLLKDGRGLVAGGWLDFETMKLAREFAIDRNPFRPRGRNERELTFGELLTRASGADGFPPEPRYLAEFHGRLVRAFALIGVALMSIPLGVTRKRAPAWPRMVLALAILVAFDQILQTVQSLASLGRIDPALGLWGVGAAFTLGSAWLYAVTPGQGSPSPLRGVLRRFDALFADLAIFGRRAGGWLGLGP